MQTMEALKRAIKTAEDLHSVVKTMKALAAVNIRQYEEAVGSLAEYNKTVQMGLNVLLRSRPETLSVVGREPTGRLGAAVFGSDQGMCGQLNDQIVSYAVESIEGLGSESRPTSVIAIGARVASGLEAEGIDLEEQLAVPGSAAGITLSVQETVMIIERWHFQQGIEHVLLFYCEHLSGASYQPRALQLLPLGKEWLTGIASREWPTRMLPTFTMNWDRLFLLLIRQYLFVSLYRAFAESLASENASRLASMQGAEKNIEQRLSELHTLFNQQRQRSITEELLDIVSGFIALTDSGPTTSEDTHNSS